MAYALLNIYVMNILLFLIHNSRYDFVRASHKTRAYTGIICSEGELWKDQRKLSTEWIRKLCGAKHSSQRHRMTDRVMTGVNEFIDVGIFVACHVLIYC